MVIEDIIAMLAPHYCALCSRPGEPLCQACVSELAEVRKPACHLCNMATGDALFCGSCLVPKPFVNAWSAGRYNDSLKYIIQRYKFEHARAAARPLAELLLGVLPQLPSGTVVTNIPTAPGRMRERGFDHARLLSEAVANARGLRASQTLVRTGNARQVGSTRAARLEQAKTLFAAKDVEPLPYLLIDDVMTTGATIDAASELLVGAGATAVYVGVVAN